MRQFFAYAFAQITKGSYYTAITYLEVIKMQSGQEKLRQDLAALEVMAAEMDVYLREDVLFWRTQWVDLPVLTLGGYLLRQHRLLVLRHLLDEADAVRLETAVSQFTTALDEKIVRTEQKAYTEIDARLRQWASYLQEAEWQRSKDYQNYATAVEPRAILDALVSFLRQAPYRLPAAIPDRIKQMDGALRSVWQSGNFVWPHEWQAAYPQRDYWWLYGRPY